MLETVTQGFRAARDRLTGARPTEEMVDAAIRDIRLALLEADVDVAVGRRFLEAVRERAKGDLVDGVAKVEIAGEQQEVTPYHRFVAICQEELETLMGPGEAELDYAPLGVTAVMVVGLQGSGKTTTAAKLARHLRAKEGRKVLLAAADLQRPAAIDQLERLGERVEVPVFAERGTDPLTVCGHALARAGKTSRDVVIFDTAGRLAIDEPLMAELKAIRDRTKPQEILLVVDAMVGQDAVRTAQAFDEALGLTGFIMTKLDGDARGGAALSIKAITGKPIKFLGLGEGMEALERFRPDGLASRILGMGDVVGLVQEFERVVDQDKAEEDAERMFRGQFDMSDFVEQIGLLKQMGSLSDLFDKMPIFQEGVPGGLRPDERELGKIVAVHDSMTPEERRRPNLVRRPSRLARVGRGCGRGEKQVLEVLGKFDTMRRMMIQLGDQPSLLSKLPGFDQVAQVRKLRGLDLADLFGDAFEPEPAPEAPEPAPEATGGRGRPRSEYFAHMQAPPPPKAKDKGREKRKKQLQKKARKKNRR